ncbi:hypothetical protein ACFIQF_09910 [Comamonas sp. J-3]|jgi:hypothetical protein|uniref:hypothetical protein n=1 Tax=Comamonas trifloxystrobinivorans TaxID=3350256 RepID=UPI00372BB626
MRALLSCLLILTLVLRGLLGDAMAMGIVAPAMPEAAHSAHQAAPTDTDAGHHGHAGAHSAAPAEQAIAHSDAAAHHQTEKAKHAPASHCAPADNSACGDSGIHGAVCSACGICHSPVGLAGLAALPALAPSHSLALAGDARFASAWSAPVAKPPISLV